MVAWRDAKSPIRRIVDGQQRLTTITIRFAVLRDQLQELAEDSFASRVHRHLENADRNTDLQFTLQTRLSSSSSVTRSSSRLPTRRSSRRPKKPMPSAIALEQIRRLIAAEVGKRQKPQQWLLDLRDRLLGLKVIWVEHGSEDDAYIIFETLNSRGKDLEVVDLLKNLLLNRLRGTRNARADTVRLKWDKMRDQLEASDGRDRINANSFILHWWQSRADYVAQRAVFADQESDQVEVSGAGLPRAAHEGWAALPCRCGARVLQLAAGGDRRARSLQALATSALSSLLRL